MTTRVHVAALAALTLIASADVASAATKVTEFRASRDSVREFCARPGRELTELRTVTTCTVRRTGMTITCDDDSNCVRQEPTYANLGGGFSIGGGAKGPGPGGVTIVDGGGYDQSNNPGTMVGGGGTYDQSGNK